MSRVWALAGYVSTPLVLGMFGCTFLVEFQDKEGTPGFDPEMDASADAAEDLDAGGSPPRDGGAVGSVCQGRPNGASWDPNDEYARCCNGLKVRTVVDEFCGTCEIACNKAKGQACQEFRGHHYCRGCDNGAECWSGCCSKQFGGGSCAASNCNDGTCSVTACTGGSVCTLGVDASNYCKY